MEALGWCTLVCVWLSLASHCQSQTCTFQKAIEDSVKNVISEAATSFINNINKRNDKQQITQVNNDNTVGESSYEGRTRCPLKDCADVALEGHTKSGVYRIWPDGWKSCGMQVYCDLEKDLGGWTVIQRRGDYGKAKDYFYRTWREYKFGFGNLSEDFWLGNDKLHHLSNQGNYALRVDMKTSEGDTAYAQYDEFYIEPESNKYKLSVYGFQGDAGDSLSPHNGLFFGTKDRDNDQFERNCAVEFKGAWWYGSCHHSNLNGLYHNGPHESHADGINWYTGKGHKYSYKEVVMKIRPTHFREWKMSNSEAPVPK